MSTSNLIPKIGEKIELLDTAIFSGSPHYWRYPACIIRQIKVDRTGSHLWFKMRNISLDDPGQKAPAFLFCYNKRLSYYMTIEGDVTVTGLAGDLRTPNGWQDPLYAHQITYLIRMEIRHASTFYRAGSVTVPSVTATIAAEGKASLFPDRSYLHPLLMNKPPKFNLPSFLTGFF